MTKEINRKERGGIVYTRAEVLANLPEGSTNCEGKPQQNTNDVLISSKELSLK
jgi:hypothetical protein